MLKTILALLGIVFIVILSFLFFPVIWRVIAIIVGIVLACLVFFGFITIALPITLILLVVILIYRLIIFLI
ncbi:MAG: hypothetical protein WBH84_02180 [Defluviitoga tunisiensis]|jgi:hypothetical protein|uniref:Putative membrane protein n=1 Tax=Defluviitoga tunisiensis TaxID=1006576 RepID=A0A0C7NZ25_DEFTU|nr:hypothetical protein [Defluviitoga tunisiensis]MDD3600986.1 hypothetical protein [Defluviitoga tunisiensis]MDY0379548.1 hypothetical protein [Defluviitoga tunisiensis]CEP78533.1 putative membrane protein [Defluviitoga tunisiensis]HHV01179.1 hypothetical protein [Defluviitoga tunisiensis]HOB55089.1 hypothetical protein [Defluviitoga tunisiensis]